MPKPIPESQRETSTCRVCGYPTVTELGRKLHESKTHGGHNAPRNREIIRRYFVLVDSVTDIARWADLHPGTVRWIIWKFMAYPKIYEALPESFEAHVEAIHQGVTPIRKRRA
jgi:hypothetical protein